MNHEGSYRRRYRPKRKVDGRDHVTALLQKALHQQNRTDGDEYILAEEQPDVVGRGGVGPDLHARGCRDGAAPFLGRLGHRCDQRAHHLRLAEERVQSQGGSDLAQQQIPQEHARRRDGVDGRNQSLHSFAQPRALEQPDHRQHEPHDADVTVLGECPAECFDDARQARSAGKTGDESGNPDHDKGIKAQGEAENDDRDAG